MKGMLTLISPLSPLPYHLKVFNLPFFSVVHTIVEDFYPSLCLFFFFFLKETCKLLVFLFSRLYQLLRTAENTIDVCCL